MHKQMQNSKVIITKACSIQWHICEGMGMEFAIFGPVFFSLSKRGKNPIRAFLRLVSIVWWPSFRSEGLFLRKISIFRWQFFLRFLLQTLPSLRLRRIFGGHFVELDCPIEWYPKFTGKTGTLLLVFSRCRSICVNKHHQAAGKLEKDWEETLKDKISLKCVHFLPSLLI